MNDRFRDIINEHNENLIENAPGKDAVKKLTREKMLDEFKKKGYPLTMGEVKPYIEGNNKKYSKDVLAAFREYFNTTTDYLLGFPDAPRWREKPDIQQAMRTTGLSEKSIKILQDTNNEKYNKASLYMLNTLIENNYFTDFLRAIYEYYRDSIGSRIIIERHGEKPKEYDARHKEKMLKTEAQTKLHDASDKLFEQIESDRTNPFRTLLTSIIIQDYLKMLVEEASESVEEKLFFSKIATDISNRMNMNDFSFDIKKMARNKKSELTEWQKTILELIHNYTLLARNKTEKE